METGNSRLTNLSLTSQATNSSTARAVQHQGNPTIPASAQVASVEVCGAGRPHRFPLPVGHGPCHLGAILSASHVQIHHLKGLPKFSQISGIRQPPWSYSPQKIIIKYGKPQLFLHITCHFDGSKLHSTPHQGVFPHKLNQ